jgi:hypothetical protein
MKGMRDGYRNECKVCNNKQKHDRYMADPNREIERVQKWRQDNAERYNAYTRARRQRPEVKAADRAGHLKRKFDLTPLQYAIKLAEQQGVCLICGRTPAEGKSLDVDHDHKSGRVRGLLCRNCNQGLGKFFDDPLVLASAIAYLFMWDQDPADAPRVRIVVGD